MRNMSLEGKMFGEARPAPIRDADYETSVMEAVEQGEYSCPQCDGNDAEIDATGRYDLICGCCGWLFDLSEAERERHGRPETNGEAGHRE